MLGHKVSAVIFASVIVGSATNALAAEQQRARHVRHHSGYASLDHGTPRTIIIAAGTFEGRRTWVVTSSTTLTDTVLVNPANVPQTTAELGIVEDAARVLGAHVVILKASNPSEIESAFASLVSERAGALVVSGENFFLTQRHLMVELVARHAVPTIYAYREFVRLLSRSGDANPVIRRYRGDPAPLVRDLRRGWRSGRIEAVLAGDFDLMGALQR